VSWHRQIQGHLYIRLFASRRTGFGAVVLFGSICRLLRERNFNELLASGHPDSGRKTTKYGIFLSQSCTISKYPQYAVYFERLTPRSQMYKDRSPAHRVLL
jgi:hypothetical protein